VLSTEGTEWFGTEKLTEVIDTYEYSQMYLPSKYSKFSGTGSAKPGDKFVKQTPSQNVGNSQNSDANPRWKTPRSSQTNGTPSRCWLCNEMGHTAVHCRKSGATQVSSSQEKRGASGKSAAGVNNVKAEPVQCNHVVTEAQNQSGTNLIGARLAQDIPDIRFPDSSIYEAADQICEETACKHANNADETDVKCVVSASHDANTGDVATDETRTRLVNRVDFSMKGGAALLSQYPFVDKMDLANCKQPLQLSELQYCNVLMKTVCGVKSVRCLKDSGAQISLIQKVLSAPIIPRVFPRKKTKEKTRGW